MKFIRHWIGKNYRSCSFWSFLWFSTFGKQKWINDELDFMAEQQLKFSDELKTECWIRSMNLADKLIRSSDKFKNQSSLEQQKIVTAMKSVLDMHTKEQ